ncbi:MAG: hypothetical protein HYV63_01550 [Candidatus Schekmanbacteria bacterium]|nr:hypothetical protein [Candidatus Schekmanbacteria bacterium]
MWGRSALVISIGFLLFLSAVRNLDAAPLDARFTYQGYLTDGGLAANGAYDLTFSLFDASADGNQIASTVTVADVTVTNGTFSTALDFGAGAFTGDERFLEIAVRQGASSGAYTPLSPRHRLDATPHAQFAISANSVPWSGVSGVPADLADGDNDTTYAAGQGLALSAGELSASFGGTGSATSVARSDHDHAGTYADSGHDHDASYYTETELNTSGAGGQVHWNNLTSVPSGLADGDQDTTYSAGNGLTLTGTTFAVSFAGTGAATTAARSDHDHNSSYYTESESDSRFVNATGDTMTGNLTVPKVAYSTPRTCYFSVSGEHFVTWTNSNYSSGGGNGGANGLTGQDHLVAAASFPQGAVITQLKLYYYDTSANNNLTGRLLCLYFTGGYSIPATAYSSGSTGYGSSSTAAPYTIDNTVQACSVDVFPTSGNWDDGGSYSLKVMGAVITYTVSEAD